MIQNQSDIRNTSPVRNSFEINDEISAPRQNDGTMSTHRRVFYNKNKTSAQRHQFAICPTSIMKYWSDVTIYLLIRHWNWISSRKSTTRHGYILASSLTSSIKHSTNRIRNALINKTKSEKHGYYVVKISRSKCTATWIPTVTKQCNLFVHILLIDKFVTRQSFPKQQTVML